MIEDVGRVSEARILRLARKLRGGTLRGAAHEPVYDVAPLHRSQAAFDLVDANLGFP